MTFFGHRFVKEGDSDVECGTSLDEESDGEVIGTVLEPILDFDFEPPAEAFSGDDIVENDDCDNNEPEDEVDNLFGIKKAKETKLKEPG